MRRTGFANAHFFSQLKIEEPRLQENWHLSQMIFFLSLSLCWILESSGPFEFAKVQLLPNLQKQTNETFGMQILYYLPN